MTAPQFEALLAVQEVDTAIGQVRHRRDHLPAHEELRSVAALRSNLDTRLADAVASRDEAADRQRRLEDELTSTERRAAEVSGRLYGGQVTASRELQVLAADVDVLKGRASDLEDRIIAVLEEREPLDALVASLAAAEAELDRRATSADVELVEGQATAEAELGELTMRREMLAAKVAKDIMATYEQLRTRLGGVGAARLVGSRCGGCHLDLPATELDRMRHEPEDVLETCDQCGRILVRP